MLARQLLPVSALASVGLFSACTADPDKADPAHLAVVESLAVVNPSLRGFNDANIVALIDHMAASDSAVAAMAASKATNAEVRAHAQRMMTEHSELRARALAAQQSLGVEPELPDREVRLRDHENAVAELDSIPAGAAWDRAYLDHEVRFHEQARELAQRSAGDTTRPELRTLADDAAQRFAAHLQAAQQLRGRLGDPAS
jgi:putative membrane protein